MAGNINDGIENIKGNIIDSDLEEWDTLETISTFDTKGFPPNHNDGLQPTSDFLLTKINNNDISNIIKRFPSQSTTPHSLIIQGLLLRLCNIHEPTEPIKAKYLFNQICAYMYQHKLIDESFSKSEFENLRFQFEQNFTHIINSLQISNIKNQQIIPKVKLLDMYASKYSREFFEIEFIAAGGFGAVYKAKHNLDCIEYAIKKIQINSMKLTNVLDHISEVKTLASLNNPNIVAYKAAWIEPLNLNENVIFTNNDFVNVNDTEDKDDEFQVSNHRQDDAYIENSSDFESSSNLNKNTSSKFVQSDTLETSNDSFIQFANSDSSTHKSRSFHLTSSSFLRKKSYKNSYHRKLKTSNSIQSSSDSNSSVIRPNGKNVKWAILYIQMELCQCTLRQWLHDRSDYLNQNINNKFSDFYKMKNMQLNIPYIYSNRSTSSVISSSENLDTHRYNHYSIILNIYRQLLNGIKYIHKYKIIHQDIKPQNIFIDIDPEDGSFCIKLGDFGLARQLESHPRYVGVGTPIYASPEQKIGHCNTKSDIYSSGIVLIELLLDCRTESELVHIILNIKTNESDDRIPKEFMDLFKLLLSEDHKNRPTTDEIYQYLNEINLSNEKSIESLQREVEKMNLLQINTIEQLKQNEHKIGLRDREIELLKRNLQSQDEVIQKLKQLLVGEQNENV